MTPDAISRLAADLRTLAALEDDREWACWMLTVAYRLETYHVLQAEMDAALLKEPPK